MTGRYGPGPWRPAVASASWPRPTPRRGPRLLVLAVFAACGGGDSPPRTEDAGPEPGVATTALETAANVVQATEPVDQIGMVLAGFHPMKADPSVQMESHHYCDQVSEDLAQCVLYDGDTDDANLHGIEYIISERLYETLADDEKPYWHPHNYEILSGQLVMPGLPAVAEEEALRRKVNSYGKTWHLWRTGVRGEPGDSLPLGPAQLAWSFNHDGEAAPGLVEERDRRMGIDSREKRRARADLASIANPQAGVATLADQFPAATSAPAGVQDNGDPAATGVPTVTIRR